MELAGCAGVFRNLDRNAMRQHLAAGPIDDRREIDKATIVNKCNKVASCPYGDSPVHIPVRCNLYWRLLSKLCSISDLNMFAASEGNPMQKRVPTFLFICLAASFTAPSASASFVYSENFDNPAFLESVFIPAGEVYGHNDRIGWTNTGIGNINNAEGWTFEEGAYL